MQVLSIISDNKEQLIDITQKIDSIVKENNYQSGTLTIFCPHTTAALTINENSDPDVKDDILKGLSIFDKFDYKHSEGNSPAHIKSSLVGSSVTIIIETGKLKLGTWQGIMFCEFDGPRNRQINLHFQASK